MTCYPDMSGELIEAGANYIDKNIVVDDQFITSRNPYDLDFFL
jgi:protease I